MRFFRQNSLCIVAITATTMCAAMLSAQPPRAGGPAGIAVSAAPTLTIGGDEADESTSFGKIWGATRLPDGRIVVGDAGDYNIRIFSPAGKQVQKLGRKGGGPGEIGFLAGLWRCGNSIITKDIDPKRASVFDVNLKYVREFRFAGPNTENSTYAYTCNSAGRFLHFGWENLKLAKAGAFRTNAPFWYSGSDATPGIMIGEFPGSERWGTGSGGKITGTGPLPFGKQPLIAVGARNGYVASGDAYEIMVFDLAGKRAGTIRDSGTPAAVTSADVEAEIDRRSALNPGVARVEIERMFAEMKLPATMPAYSALIVDANDLLWARDYQRANSKTVRWSVFSNDGKLVSRLNLPSTLVVYEIGKDHLLGQYLDPEELIPQIRMYRVTR